MLEYKTDCLGNTEYKLKTGLLHRDDGPAKIFVNGTKHWYYMGKLHRIGGPAIEWSTGDASYFIEGKLYTLREYWSYLLETNQVDKFDVFPKLLGSNEDY